MAAMVRPGDEVILFEPAYDSYAPAVEVHGGMPVYVQLTYPDYAIDWQAVQRAITPRTRAIVINTPNNPTASVFSAEDLRMLEGLLRGTDIVLVSDEVYEHIVFDGHAHQSVARFPGLAERSFIVSSFGKTYHVTGWKMGYVLAPRELMAEFRKVHQFNVFVTNGPIQYALAEYMKDRDAYLVAGGVLSAQARFLPRRAAGLALAAAAFARHVFPEPALRRDQRRARHGPRGASYARARCRIDPGFRLLSRAAAAQGAALLFREIRRDARERRSDPQPPVTTLSTSRLPMKHRRQERTGSSVLHGPSARSYRLEGRKPSVPRDGRSP